ncbi:MAG: phenylalanine--tRNA ligase subunit beta [Burkholderiaceae bacterium]
MRIPEQWLRSFCAPNWSGEELANRLTMAGLEVEEREPFAPAFTSVVVAEITDIAPHPDADKLRVCQVNVGANDSLEIVCGAPNAAAGMRVPCAVPGAELPGGFKIKPVKMRGVKSNGMLCSARELGISEDHAGLLELSPDAPIGASIRDHLDLDEMVLTLKLTPNLAHCLSVFGVAREVSALSKSPLNVPDIKPVPVTLDDRLPVKIEAADLCGRFSGRIIRGINARAQTPDWIKSRLERAGQRAISPLVDISNYVMLELGRPTHVFDLAKIHGGLTVRWGRPDEKLKLLNGQTISLDQSFGVISDEQQVESLAGIMGGDDTAVTDATTDIYLEAAFWWPDAIAGRARRLNFSTDASHRFERGVDPALTVDHIEVITRMIVDICGGEVGPIDDQWTTELQSSQVSLRFDRARQLIGVALPDDEIVGVFDRLGFKATRSAGAVTVEIPSYRFDLNIEEDLVEEVARIHGYDELPLRPPLATLPMRPAPHGVRSTLSLKRAIAAREYQEVINYSFVNGDLDRQLGQHDPIALLNPIAQTQDVMRTTLWGGMLGAMLANQNRKAARIRLFETGRVFWRNANQTGGDLAVAGIDQPECIAAVATGSAAGEQWGERERPVDFFDLKLDLESLDPDNRLMFQAAAHPALHPGRSAQILLNRGEALAPLPVGWIGELHPKIQQSLDLNNRVQLFELLLEPLLSREPIVFEPVSKYPPSIRDLAIVIDESVPAAQIDAEIRSISKLNEKAGVIKNIRLFDEYRGKGLENKEKSLAFRLWMQDTDRTLEEAEVAAATETVLAGLQSKFSARLR